jgi:cysteine desulfurase
MSPSNCSKPLYLDFNATTPVIPPVAAAIGQAVRTCFGNPSSTHPYGVRSKAVIDESRKHLARLIGAAPHEIIFTSGGTESNNMAILGTALRFQRGHIISSCIEHPSVMNVLKHLECNGFDVTCLPVDSSGALEEESIERHLRKDTILITLMHSNNETGTLQPVGAAGAAARRRGIVFHSDAAQSVGKVPVNVRRLNTDLLTIAAHKFYGPKGIGALYIREGTPLHPILYGASQERGLRPGTENIPEIAGLGAAAAIAREELRNRVSAMKRLSRHFHAQLRKDIPGIRLNGHPTKRLPNTLNLSFPGISGSALLEMLCTTIAASTGSACHAGCHSPSAVLTAMGMSDALALSAVRFSLGRGTTEKQLGRAAKAIAAAYRRLSGHLA